MKIRFGDYLAVWDSVLSLPRAQSSIPDPGNKIPQAASWPKKKKRFSKGIISVSIYKDKTKHNNLKKKKPRKNTITGTILML